jgi:hypothetical protein
VSTGTLYLPLITSQKQRCSTSRVAAENRQQ